ncbi:uncharacterized protein LOC132795901 [Drosophila nasuta]|uniref:uncharacterized protein LOC132795901 n=1 Tax=Drosophila nasuta TaxID=42062 RepID=UPI00295E769A|nr:uncharacterized protein LOC132795901 [Drosophila nasuta]
MAFLSGGGLNCNCIYVLCLIIFAWQLCVAKQLPLPANVAAAAATNGATTNVGRSSSSSSNNNNNNNGGGSGGVVHQPRHESYVADDIDDESDAAAAAPPATRRRRQVSDWFIAPNTRWCGKGNLANGTYNQLGGASMADKCCRTHDHCQKFIPALSTRYELFNYRPYTLSHCKCDRRFRTCLKMAHDEDANTIGKLFFNMVQTQCFVLKTEYVCTQRGSDPDDCIKGFERKKAYLKDNLKF